MLWGLCWEYFVALLLYIAETKYASLPDIASQLCKTAVLYCEVWIPMQKQRFHYISDTVAEDFTVSKAVQRPPNHLKGETFLAHRRVCALLYQPAQNLWRILNSDVTWCFSDRASWIDYILITNFDSLIIIYS